VADFEDALSELFQAGEDDALADRLTAAAISQIEREDRRRQWVLTAGVAAGITVSLATIVGSGALSDAGSLGLRLIADLPHLMGQPLALAGAAAVFAAYAAATLRPGRTL
jgi:hypothetical protein